MRLIFLYAISFLISCSKPKEIKSGTYQLSDITDSAIYDDLKFGITRADLLKKIPGSPQQNIMSEPIFDTDVVEIEDGIDIQDHHFVLYYYFDIHDSLYRIKGEYRTENEMEYKDAAMDIAKMIYVPYGIPKRWKTVPGSYKFSWELKNKQIFLEFGSFISNYIVEIMITELRLFIKNRDRIIPNDHLRH
jgi:hypothetical protein